MNKRYIKIGNIQFDKQVHFLIGICTNSIYCKNSSCVGRYSSSVISGFYTFLLGFIEWNTYKESIDTIIYISLNLAVK